MRTVGLPHCRLGKEISFDRARVVVGDFGKARIGKDRKIVRTIGPCTLAQRIEELRVAPPADARVRIRGDVRGIEGAKRGCEGAAASVRTSAVLGVGMTALTTSGGGQILAARHQICLRRLGSEPAENQEYDGDRRRQSFNFSRNVWWQAPQPFFPRSPKAASIFALSPLFTATRSTSAFSAAVFCASRNLLQSVQIAGLVAYFPSELGPPVPGGNTSAIFFVDWARPAAPASACANSSLPSM